MVAISDKLVAFWGIIFGLIFNRFWNLTVRCQLLALNLKGPLRINGFCGDYYRHYVLLNRLITDISDDLSQIILENFNCSNFMNVKSTQNSISCKYFTEFLKSQDICTVLKNFKLSVTKIIFKIIVSFPFSSV